MTRIAVRAYSRIEVSINC